MKLLYFCLIIASALSQDILTLSGNSFHVYNSQNLIVKKLNSYDQLTPKTSYYTEQQGFLRVLLPGKNVLETIGPSHFTYNKNQIEFLYGRFRVVSSGLDEFTLKTSEVEFRALRDTYYIDIFREGSELVTQFVSLFQKVNFIAKDSRKFVVNARVIFSSDHARRHPTFENSLRPLNKQHFTELSENLSGKTHYTFLHDVLSPSYQFPFYVWAEKLNQEKLIDLEEINKNDGQETSALLLSDSENGSDGIGQFIIVRRNYSFKTANTEKEVITEKEVDPIFIYKKQKSSEVLR